MSKASEAREVKYQKGLKSVAEYLVSIAKADAAEDGLDVEDVLFDYEQDMHVQLQQAITEATNS